LAPALFLAAMLGACEEVDYPSAISGGRIGMALELVADGFIDPVFVTQAPGNPDRLFVVEQGGLIWVVRDGVVLTEPFLDLTGSVSAGGERGLLGLAFHPLYLFNGWFFVSYTDVNGDTRVVRYSVSFDPDRADSDSGLEILFIEQPYANHNGGMLAFGPNDGFLYVGLGDGGGSGDPDDNGQDRSTLLGAMLRIDVQFSRETERYRIPATNPFRSDPASRPEIWAYGLRNPWRFSFDPITGDLYVGDVGQDSWEEVSVQLGSSPGGENFGWPRMEGTHCYRPATGCATATMTRPVYEYGHDEGCSVTGGYVYQGRAIPALLGRYLFADFCEGWIRSFVLDGGRATAVRDHTNELIPGDNVVSFGQDVFGELYVVARSGAIYRIAAD
jgi:glucose/arabinose dehydrogenase